MSDLTDSERLANLEERLEKLEAMAGKLITVAKVHPTGRLILRALGVKVESNLYPLCRIRFLWRWKVGT